MNDQEVREQQEIGNNLKISKMTDNYQPDRYKGEIKDVKFIITIEQL